MVCVPKPLNQIIILANWCKSLLNIHSSLRYDISKIPTSPVIVRGQMLVLSSGEVIGLTFFSLSPPPLHLFLLFLLFLVLFPPPAFSLFSLASLSYIPSPKVLYNFYHTTSLKALVKYSFLKS